MQEPKNKKTPRNRSPGFPFISLEPALSRLSEFDKNFGCYSVPVGGKVGPIWGLKEGSSQTFRILAALRYFGLIKYCGSGIERKAFTTEDGRNYLQTRQIKIKKDLLKKFALRPEEISRFWNRWKSGRPQNKICLDYLVSENGYNVKYAFQFLKVYDDTIAFAGLLPRDAVSFAPDDRVDERILQNGILSQNATYRITVTGKIGAKEIGRLIKKLELDKEILTGPEEDLK